MKVCVFCQSTSPDSAKFCAQCGHKIDRAEDGFSENTVTSISNVHSSDDMEHEILHPFDDLDEEQTFSILQATPKDDDDDDDSLIPFPPILGNPPQTPNNLLVQNPLHVDQIPYSVQPHLPAAQPMPYSVQPQLPAQLSQVAPIQPFNTPPLSSYTAMAPPPPPLHQRPHHPRHRVHLPRVRPTCLMLVVIAFIGLSILGVIIITFGSKTPSPLTPTAQLVGVPIPGQKMILHGGSFVPGETVIIVIDQKSSAFAANSANISELFGQHTAQTPSGVREIVRVDGTFSLTFPVDRSWPIGSVHTVYVYKQDGTLIKLPPFTVIAPSVSTGLVGCLNQTASIKLGPIDENSTQSVSKTIVLCTQGSGTVNWQARVEQTWLKLPSSGQIQAPNTGHLTITGSAKRLKPGAYITTITLSSRQSVALVRLNIVLVVTKAGTANADSLPPGSKRTLLQTRPIECISVAPQAVSFASLANQASTLSKSVQVNNCGTNEPWSASVSTNDGNAWLGINTSQGKMPSTWFQEVIVTVSSATLLPGTYTGQVTFYTGTSSADVQVTFTVLSPTTTSSCINVQNQSFTFVGVAGQNDPPSQATTLINCGATGQWSASAVTDDGADWIHLSPRSYTLKEKERQQVNVSVSSAQLKGGTYTGKITFFMGTSSVKVNVTFVVEQACIQVDYPELLYTSRVGEGALQNIITITNCGYAGTWNASTSTDDGAQWLTINKISGSLAAKAKERIAVDVSSTHLHEGMYTGDILFIMGTSTTTVRVKFVIVKPAAPPCLSVNTNVLNFFSDEGQRLDAQVLTVGNCGSVAVSWKASTNGVQWISTDISQGELKHGGDTQDIRVALSSERLSPGTYRGHITFSTWLKL